jgi:epoxyqueuosine reductase
MFVQRWVLELRRGGERGYYRIRQVNMEINKQHTHPSSKNLNANIEKLIKNYTAESAANRLKDIDGSPIFDEPLIGFADGDAAIFDEYKKIIGDFHLTPRQVLATHLQAKGIALRPDKVSVVSFIMPATEQTRISLRQETLVASLRWNHTRWQGQDFINELSKYIAAEIEKLGFAAIAPEQSPYFKLQSIAAGSTWSQRHIAYAAGLGTFSLSDGFITPKGMAMRAGSVVTDAPLSPSPLPYAHFRANCLFYRGLACGKCIKRCPAGAISENGHDKQKCFDFLNTGQKKILQELGRESGYVGRYVACGLCQTGVPCEAGIPPEPE